MMVKKLIDDPKLDKKQLVSKLLSKIKSEDFSSLQNLLTGQELDPLGFDENEENISKSFEVIHTL